MSCDVEVLLAAKATRRGRARHRVVAQPERRRGRSTLPGWTWHKYPVGSDGEREASWPAPLRRERAAVGEAIAAELRAAAVAPGPSSAASCGTRPTTGQFLRKS